MHPSHPDSSHTTYPKQNPVFFSWTVPGSPVVCGCDTEPSDLNCDWSTHDLANDQTCLWYVDTVDGRNPAPVDTVNIPLFTGCHTCWVVQDFFHQQYYMTKATENTTEILLIQGVLVHSQASSQSYSRYAASYQLTSKSHNYHTTT